MLSPPAGAVALGPDAFLLDRIADERTALANDAAGIDPAVEELARRDAAGLRQLAQRHAVHYAGRDVAPRVPFVEDEPTACPAHRGRNA